MDTVTDRVALDGRPAGPPVKPRLRGWSHLAFTVPAAFMSGVLVGLAHGHLGRQFALLAYGASSVLLFGVSGIYHAVTWSPQRRALLRRIDHANIFLLVAGTYTPIVLTELGGAWMISLISVVWGIAVLGLILVVPALHIPRWALAACYLAQGWVAIIALPVIGGAVGAGGIALILVGGGLYTLGALAYAVRRPNPVPGWFGYHEVFHVLVIAANCMFFSFMVAEVAGRP